MGSISFLIYVIRMLLNVVFLIICMEELIKHTKCSRRDKEGDNSYIAFSAINEHCSAATVGMPPNMDSDPL